MGDEVKYGKQRKGKRSWSKEPTFIVKKIKSMTDLLKTLGVDMGGVAK